MEDSFEVLLPDQNGMVEVIEVGDAIGIKEFEIAIHGAILSMSKYKEGEIKEALDEYINLLYAHLGLEHLHKNG